MQLTFGCRSPAPFKTRSSPHCQRLRPLLAWLLVVGAGHFAPAATLTWTNTSGGNWNFVANWSPNAVPGAADTANLTTPGIYTVTLNADATIAALNLGAASGTQTLAMSANTLTPTVGVVNANGVLAISGGGVSGKLTVQAGGVMNFAGTAQKSLYSLTLVNQGTVNHTGGQLYHGSTPTTVITNTGLWDIQGDFNLSQGIGGPQAQWVNRGTLRKSAGAGVAQINTMDMINTASGIIQCAVGTLR